MKTLLLTLAVLLLAGTSGFWLVAGGNRGWTKTSVPRKTLDEITGIEAITYEKKFVPGIDFLGAGCLAAAALGALSFVPFKRRQPHS